MVASCRQVCQGDLGWKVWTVLLLIGQKSKAKITHAKHVQIEWL